MLKNIPTLGIVVPCYNEEEVLTETNARLTRLLTSMIETSLIAEQSAIYYVDDGSRDKTWALIEKFSKNNPLVCGVKLSCNRGHQNALWCGLMTVPGDILVSIDADLQDDINVIPKMVNEFLDGKEIVYGVRDTRASDTFFKRFSAELFYKLMKVMGVDLVFNHADYRLLSRRALDALSEYQEVNLFLRGIVRLLGFTSSIVKYDRAERFARESKYPLKKMLAFAWQGISSFSIVPLRLITLLGFAISLLSIFWVMELRSLPCRGLCCVRMGINCGANVFLGWSTTFRTWCNRGVYRQDLP